MTGQTGRTAHRTATLSQFGLTTDHMRLPTPPSLHVPWPQCGACHLDVRSEDDLWVCEGCGTSWPIPEAEDGTVGTLFEDWSGESLGDRPAIRTDRAWQYSHLPPGEREARAARNGDLA